MTDKEAVLRQIYYDKDTGFGSISETYRNANKVLNTITYQDTKDWLDKQKSRQTKAYRGFNSYVSPKALHEFQIDIGDWTETAADNNGFRFMFLAVDTFSKFIHCVAIRNKQPAESVRAFEEILKVIGVPSQIMSDREGAWESKEFVRLLNAHKIKHIISSSPPPFSERAVQEIKNMIHARLDGLDLNKEKWIDMLEPVLKKYNNRVHGTTGLSPKDARKEENSIQVYLNIRNHAEYKRKYPKLSVGDSVRTYVKPHTFKKGYHSSWSKEIYKIMFIKDNQYIVNDSKRKVYNRWELLKISGVETKDG